MGYIPVNVMEQPHAGHAEVVTLEISSIDTSVYYSSEEKI